MINEEHQGLNEKKIDEKNKSKVKNRFPVFSISTLKDLANQSLDVKIFFSIALITTLSVLSGGVSLAILFFSGNVTSVQVVLISFLIFTSLISGRYLTQFMKRTTLIPIHELTENIDRITAGDFSLTIEPTYNDEIGHLADRFNQLLKSLREMMGMLSGEQAAAYMAAEEMNDAKEYVDRKVTEMLDGLERFSNGDLTVELSIEKEDDIGRLYAGFNQVIKNFNEIILTVRQSTDLIKQSGELLNQATVALKDDTDRNVASTDEILQKVEFLNMSAQSISVTSRETLTIVRDGIKITSSADENVIKTQQFMTEIAENAQETDALVQNLNTSTTQISEIVSLIKEIASQTNLLALNAAIEAARAGQYGRGFAVVADETQKLAERTTDSTTEISDKINSIQAETTEVTNSISEVINRINLGLSIAETARQALNKVVDSNEMGAQLVEQIDASSDMQTESNKEITSGIRDIVSSIQSSQERIQEISKTTTELHNLTVSLDDTLLQFTLEPGEIMEQSVVELSPMDSQNSNGEQQPDGVDYEYV